jgi:serine/threonine-protein kinase
MAGQLEKGSKLGQYEIVGPLGKGGMATVYQAYQPSLDREVAIKIMADQYASDPAFAERFRREARSIARLRHPNILTVYDAGENDGILYIVMELIEGATLKEEINGKPTSIEKAGKIIEQIGSALHYANKAGIIHRDVKPSNVLIDSSGRAVLSDFGIAKMAEAKTQLTSTGTGVGTPDYMSPEQAMGEELDARSDEYSLGVMLYEMLTGRPPFTGDTPIAVVMGHVSKPLPSARQLNPDIPPSVERVMNKALSKKAVDRYDDCAAFNTALQEAILNKDKEPKGAAPAVTPGAATQMEFYNPSGRPGSGSYQTYATNPEGEQLYNDARRLEQQNNFYGAFEAFNRLNSRFPNYRDVPTVLERYRAMGYGSPQQGPGWATQAPTNMSGQSYGSTGYYAPPKASQKSGSPLPIIFGVIGTVAVVVVIVVVIIVASGGSGKKDPTPTAIAANTTTAAITTAGATTTAAPNTTSAGATTTASPSTTTSSTFATVGPDFVYPGSTKLAVPATLNTQLGDTLATVQNAKVEAYKSSENIESIRASYEESLDKLGWNNTTPSIDTAAADQLRTVGAFVLGFEKGGSAVAVLGLPGSFAGLFDFVGVGQNDTLILVISGTQ